MFEAKSEDIRRFFDLLGSISCGFFYGFAIWQDTFSHKYSDSYFYLPVFIIAVLFIYLPFHYLIWRLLKSRFLFGYANFLLISILGSSIMFPILYTIENLKYTQNLSEFVTRIEFLTSNFRIINILPFYSMTSLPMAIFWFIGTLTAWKFAKKNYLP